MIRGGGGEHNGADAPGLGVPVTEAGMRFRVLRVHARGGPGEVFVAVLGQDRAEDEVVCIIRAQQSEEPKERPHGSHLGQRG